MILRKGWVPLLSILFICDSHADDFQPLAGNQTAAKRIMIIDGRNNDYRNAGDTLWLTNIHQGDTLAFSFKARSGSGFGWDLTQQRSLKRIDQKITDPTNVRGQNIWRLYLFEFIVFRPESLMVDFVYRRSESESPLRKCIVLPQ